MQRRFRNAKLRKLLTQVQRQDIADRVFRFKVAGVDEIQPAPGGFFELVIFEVGGYEGIAARREHFVDCAAAAAAAT